MALRELLLQALLRGGDVLYQVQRLVGHDLVRHGLISSELRFMSSSGEAADVTVEVTPPEQVIEHHDASNAELLELVRVRLNEDTRIEQAEREQLVSLARDILGRLGRMSGR